MDGAQDQLMDEPGPHTVPYYPEPLLGLEGSASEVIQHLGHHLLVIDGHWAAPPEDDTQIVKGVGWAHGWNVNPLDSERPSVTKNGPRVTIPAGDHRSRLLIVQVQPGPQEGLLDTGHPGGEIGRGVSKNDEVVRIRHVGDLNSAKRGSSWTENGGGLSDDGGKKQGRKRISLTDATTASH